MAVTTNRRKSELVIHDETRTSVPLNMLTHFSLVQKITRRLEVNQDEFHLAFKQLNSKTAQDLMVKVISRKQHFEWLLMIRNRLPCYFENVEQMQLDSARVTNETLMLISELFDTLERLELNQCVDISPSLFEYMLVECIERVDTQFFVEKPRIHLYPTLAKLSLCFCNINDRTLADIAHFFPGLTSLHLDCTHVSDLGMSYLIELKSLEVLSVVGCEKVTNDASLNIVRMQHIRKLDLASTGLDQQGIKKLETLLKNRPSVSLIKKKPINRIRIEYLTMNDEWKREERQGKERKKGQEDQTNLEDLNRTSSRVNMDSNNLDFESNEKNGKNNESKLDSHEKISNPFDFTFNNDNGDKDLNHSEPNACKLNSSDLGGHSIQLRHLDHDNTIEPVLSHFSHLLNHPSSSGFIPYPPIEVKPFWTSRELQDAIFQCQSAFTLFFQRRSPKSLIQHDQNYSKSLFTTTHHWKNESEIKSSSSFQFISQYLDVSLKKELKSSSHCDQIKMKEDNLINIEGEKIHIGIEDELNKTSIDEVSDSVHFKSNQSVMFTDQDANDFKDSKNCRTSGSSSETEEDTQKEYLNPSLQALVFEFRTIPVSSQIETRINDENFEPLPNKTNPLKIKFGQHSRETAPMQGEMNQLNNQSKLLKIENNTLEGGTSQVKSEVNEMEKNDQVKNKTDQLESGINEIQDPTGLLESKKDQLESETNEVEGQADQLESEMNETQYPTGPLEDEIDQLESKTKQVEIQKDQLESEMNEMQDSTRLLESEMNEIQSPTRLLETKNNQLETKTELSKIKSKQSKRKINQLETKKQSKTKSNQLETKSNQLKSKTKQFGTKKQLSKPKTNQSNNKTKQLEKKRQLLKPKTNQIKANQSNNKTNQLEAKTGPSKPKSNKLEIEPLKSRLNQIETQTQLAKPKRNQIKTELSKSNIHQPKDKPNQLETKFDPLQSETHPLQTSADSRRKANDFQTRTDPLKAELSELGLQFEDTKRIKDPVGAEPSHFVETCLELSSDSDQYSSSLDHIDVECIHQNEYCPNVEANLKKMTREDWLAFNFDQYDWTEHIPFLHRLASPKHLSDLDQAHLIEQEIGHFLDQEDEQIASRYHSGFYLDMMHPDYSAFWYHSSNKKLDIPSDMPASLVSFQIKLDQIPSNPESSMDNNQRLLSSDTNDEIFNYFVPGRPYLVCHPPYVQENLNRVRDDDVAPRVVNHWETVYDIYQHWLPHQWPLHFSSTLH